MKISYEWLTDFVDWIEKDPEKIAETITRCMGEVDHLEYQGKYLSHCVVGKVESVEKHPNADKLLIAQVLTDQGTKTVVCGGTNVKAGMLVAFAHIGAKVRWHGGDEMTLAPVKIRGVESAGMICAQEELGLEEFPPSGTDGERPIIDLTTRNYAIGKPLKEALGLEDIIFHIDNHAITHRPDLFSHLGVAREVVAMNLARWKSPQPKAKTLSFLKNEPALTCINDIPHLIPHYLSCTLKIDSMGSTPDWMKKRLHATGWRSKNTAVDITNYVAMEIGMPLHSFDVDDISGTVRMRTAKNGEKITTLDGEERLLPEGAIILSDDKGIFDLLGIMGGLRSSTKETTKNIYLHAAIVDPISIRRAIIATGHRTEASTVYEKGIPLCSAELGFNRALQLMKQLIPGAKINSKKVVQGTTKKKRMISVEQERIESIIGMPLEKKLIQLTLQTLGCDVKKKAHSFSITPPDWRNDLNRPEDMVEEIARIVGYNAIPAVMPDACMQPPKREKRINLLRDALKELQWNELIHLAFTNEERQKRFFAENANTVHIENPLNGELESMRTAILPALIETAIRECEKCEESSMKFFEYGHVFSKNNEHQELGLVIVTKQKTLFQNDPALLIKRDLVDALKDAGYTLTIKQIQTDVPRFAHTARYAEVYCGEKKIGHLFELHPLIQEQCGARGRIAAAVLDIDTLLSIAPTLKLAQALPQFPAIEFDETVAVKERSYETLHRTLLQKNPLLQELKLVSLYEKEGTRTMTLRFTYRSNERTLTQEEVQKVHASMCQALHE